MDEEGYYNEDEGNGIGNNVSEERAIYIRTFIRFVCPNTQLYVKRSKGYSKCQDKSLTWASIGAAMTPALTSLQAEKLFHRLREKFGKERKKVTMSMPRSGAGVGTPIYMSTWIFYHNLLFLADHIITRQKHGSKEIDMQGRPTKSKNDGSTNCDLCGKSFSSIPATIRHKFKVHPNSFDKFHCSYCGKRFPLKSHRDNHQFLHDPSESEKKEQHKKCQECNVLFYNEEALNYHVRSIHKRLVYMLHPIVTPPPSNKIKLNSMNDALSVYYCHLCGIEYVMKFNLQRHLEKHTKEERETIPQDLIKCKVCSALFCNKKAYDVHNGYHRPDDLYVTSEQQRMQTVTKIDQDFDVRRVEAAANRFKPQSSVFKRTKHWTHSMPNKISKTEIKDTNRERSVSSDELAETNEVVLGI